MGKAVKKIAKAASKFTKSKIADPLGISKYVSLSPVEDLIAGPEIPKADTSATDALTAALQAQRATANVDLGLDNVAQVEAGGTAADQANPTRRRRGASSSAGVAQSLGIRV